MFWKKDYIELLDKYKKISTDYKILSDEHIKLINNYNAFLASSKCFFAELAKEYQKKLEVLEFEIKRLTFLLGDKEDFEVNTKVIH